ncbi:hypothetical protein [Pseudomonas phage ANB1]|nr:hypothetical protein [Pseudomonas phage ANB1]
MGEYTQNGIRHFRPDDTEDTFYILGDCYVVNTIADIVEMATKKWGDGITLDMINISTEYIHTSCLGHDEYDPGDYSNYLCISRIRETPLIK